MIYWSNMEGREKVLKVLEEIYPEAPIFTLVFNEEKMGRFFDKKKIKTSFLQNLPFGKSAYRCVFVIDACGNRGL